MIRVRGFGRRLAVACAIVIAASGIAATSASAAASTVSVVNFRLTGLTATTATFSWSVQTQPSTQWPIRFRLYRDGSIVATDVTSQITVTGLAPGQTGDYSVDAVEPSGAVSARTPVLRVTTRAPGVPPSGVANLRSTAVTPGSATLAWDLPVDSFDIVALQVFDGSALLHNAHPEATSTKVRHLVPGTSHSFTVRVLRDIGVSAPSNAVTVALPPSDDRQAPTVPANLEVRAERDCGWWRLTWTQSTDNSDPQSAIEYEIFVNGRLRTIAQGVGTTTIDAYDQPSNTFSLRAVDTSSNTSATSAGVTVPMTRSC